MSEPELTDEQALDDVWETDDREPRQAPFYLAKKAGRDRLPPALKRAKSAMGFLSAWKRLRLAVWTARGIPYDKLPEFAVKWGKRLYETHEREAYDAVCTGDVMFFEAWAVRLLIIDQTAEAAGLTIAERGTILHAYGVLRGYGDAAAKRLKALGGTWPPTKK